MGAVMFAKLLRANQAVEDGTESGLLSETPDVTGAEIVCCGSQSPLQVVEHTNPGVYISRGLRA